MTRVEIIPDTGHHFFRVEGEEEWWGKLNAYRRKDLHEAFCESTGWSTPNDGNNRRINWIRWRIVPNKSGANHAPSLEVVVESNLGDNRRGVVLRRAEQVAHRDFKGQPMAPYAFRDNAEIEAGGKYKFSVSLGSLLSAKQREELESRGMPGGAVPPPLPEGAEGGEEQSLVNGNFFAFEVTWPTVMASQPIPVDLVVDFGNTRTVALLLEESPGAALESINALKQRIRALDFGVRGSSDYSEEVDAAIIDSWFVIQEPQFSSLEYPQVQVDHVALKDLHTETSVPKKSLFGGSKQVPKTSVVAETSRLPQMFVELSPVVVGRDAVSSLWGLKVEGGGRSFLSSPKRYVWEDRVDDHESQIVWTMVRNTWNPGLEERQNAVMQGQVLRFFPQTGADWELNDPPIAWGPGVQPAANPVRPVYPRSDALAWMALSVIEAAWRKINTQEYWRNHHPYVPRFIRSVQVTHPSGWTDQEIAAYRRKWQKAINTFTLGHFPEGSDPPELRFPIDEAVAAQLPIIFSEIHRTGGLGENFVHLFGRPVQDPGVEATHCMRVMSIDIGGGTTDFAIVEYHDAMPGAGVELVTELLFRDSFSVAGDMIVKEVLEQVFLGKLAEQWDLDSDGRVLFETFFNESFRNQSEQEKWKKICRLALVPRAVSWLDDLCQGREINQTNRREDGSTIMDDSDAGLGGLASLWGEFCLRNGEDVGGLFDSSDYNLPSEVSREEIETAVRRVMAPVVADLAKYVHAYDVDLVVLSGKPSEIPVIRDLVEAELPIAGSRVVFVRDYKAGEWYPFHKLGKVSDAKTVTAVGLALYRAISRGQVPEWSIKSKARKQSPRRHYWLKLPTHPGQEPEMVLEAEDDARDCILHVNSRIARSFLPSSHSPEPTYILAWKGQEEAPRGGLKVSLERVVPDNGGSESLRVREVELKDGSLRFSPDDFELRVCTLSGNDYWLDAPRFEITNYS